MPSLSGSGYPFVGCVRAADDGRGDIILKYVESQDEVFRVWGGNGGGVDSSPSIDSS